MTAQGIAAYAITFEEYRDLGGRSSSNFVQTNYYYLPMPSFEDAMTTPYIEAWNTLLQTLFVPD